MTAIGVPPAIAVADPRCALSAEAATPRRARGARRAVRHVVRAVRVVVAIALGLVVCRSIDVIWGDNQASIVAGEAYRSGQLSGAQLDRLIAGAGLKSVINLRGTNPRPWYIAERASCDEAGVAHFDLPMTARELPEPALVLELLTILREAPRPLLVHCKSGADRSGLAAALYLMQDEGLDVDEARRIGLSAWRGHLPFGATGELDRFLNLYRRHGADKSFERWVREDYPRIFRHEWRPARRIG